MIVNKSGVERIFCDYCDKWLEETDYILYIRTKGKPDEHYCCERHHFDKRDNL